MCWLQAAAAILAHMLFNSSNIRQLLRLHCPCSLLSQAIEVCAVTSCNDGASVPRRRMLGKQQDPESVAKFQAKLQGHAKKMGGTFVHYNSQKGVWILKVEHF
jgi:hypothetical protein